MSQIEGDRNRATRGINLSGVEQLNGADEALIHRRRRGAEVGKADGRADRSRSGKYVASRTWANWTCSRALIGVERPASNCWDLLWPKGLLDRRLKLASAACEASPCPCANAVTVNATGSARAAVRQSGLRLEFAKPHCENAPLYSRLGSVWPRQKARRRSEEHPTSQVKGILISRQAGCKFLFCRDFFALTMSQSHLGLTKSRRISNSQTVLRRDFVGLTSFKNGGRTFAGRPAPRCTQWICRDMTAKL